MATRITFGPDQFVDPNNFDIRKDGLLVQEAAVDVATDLAASTDAWPTFTLVVNDAPVSVNPSLVRYVNEES